MIIIVCGFGILFLWILSKVWKKVFKNVSYTIAVIPRMLVDEKKETETERKN